MRNKFPTPFFIILAAMSLFALIFAISVDVYDSLFWTRFVFALIAIPLSAVSILRALKNVGLPMILRSMCVILLYIIGCFGVLAFINYAVLAAILCIALNLCYSLFLFLDHSIMNRT